MIRHPACFVMSSSVMAGLLATSAVSCNRPIALAPEPAPSLAPLATTVAAVSQPDTASQPVTLRAVFDTQPSLIGRKLKSRVTIYRPANRTVTYSVGLQALATSGRVTDIDRGITEATFFATGTAATPAKAIITTVDDLSGYRRLIPKAHKVRLKITLAPGQTALRKPGANDRVFYSRWIEYR